MNDHQTLAKTLQDILESAAKALDEIKDGEKEVRSGAAYGDLKNDTELKADLKLQAWYQKALETKLENVATIQIEGAPLVKGSGSQYHVICDPLDGSLNYKMRGHGLGLPYGACIAVFEGDDANQLTYRNLCAAAAIDYRPRKHPYASALTTWASWKSKRRYVAVQNGRLCRTLREKNLDIGQMIVFGEMYYPENRKVLSRMFKGQKGWLRNPGCASYEMALVASGTAAAFICNRQKQHELPTGAALVLGAGGVAIDFDGNSLLNAPFDFNAQQPTILAANQAIADQLLELFRRP